WIISASAHVALFVVLAVSGFFARERFDDVTVAEVSILSESEYAALLRPETAPATQSETEDVPAPDPVDDAPPETPSEDVPPAVPSPQAVEAPEVPEPPELIVPDRVPEAAVLADAPEIEMPETDVDGSSLERDVVAAPAPRVAPTPSIAPPPDAEVAPERVEDVAPAEDAPPEDVVEEQQPSAPKEASDRIVTEAEETRELAPASSMRPRSRPVAPRRLAEESEEVEEPREPTTDDAVAAALSDDTADTQPAAPTGPPLTSGERDNLRVAVEGCWNVGSLSTDAFSTTVVVSVEMQQDGRPVTESITLVSSNGSSDTATRQAFEAARRAILRCGARGFPLPVEKYAQWRDIEMTFNPNGMQVR
ncbi:MAG: hypothetical protein AAF762_13005, partial [Pseudomonadota bacterium]